MWQENRLLMKQLQGNPLHPINQTAIKVQNLKWENGHTIYTCIQPQITIRKRSSRSSGESTDENMTTLGMIRTWICLLGAYFWMPLFKQQFILNKTMRRIYDTWRIIIGTVRDSIPRNWKTDQWTKRNHWCITIDFKDAMWMSTSSMFEKAFQITNAKPTSSPTRCSVWEKTGRWSHCDLVEQK